MNHTMTLLDSHTRTWSVENRNALAYDLLANLAKMDTLSSISPDAARPPAVVPHTHTATTGTTGPQLASPSPLVVSADNSTLLAPLPLLCART